MVDKRIIGAAAGVAAAGVAAGIAAARRRGHETVYYVLPRDEGWALQQEGAKAATSMHATKREAVDAGRRIAARQTSGKLVIHRLDGTVQTTHTYGNG